MNAENRGVLWNILALQDMHPAVFDIVSGDSRNRSGARHLADEHERGKHHANFHSEGQVGYYGECHRDEPYGNVGGAELQDFRDFLPFPHVVSHDHQDGGQRGERNVFHQWRRE